MKRLLLALALLLAGSGPLWAQQSVEITNIQAVDYTHDAALSLGTTSGPLGMCRTSAARPTVATGDTRAFAVWCNQYGAVHFIPTANDGTDISAGTNFFRLSTASTNSVNVKNAPGRVHLIHLSNPTGTEGYLKLYNVTTAPTCSSATSLVESLWVGAGAVNGRAYPLGATYGTGIGICFVASGADTSNDTAVAGVEIYIEVTP